MQVCSADSTHTPETVYQVLLDENFMRSTTRGLRKKTQKLIYFIRKKYISLLLSSIHIA